MIMNKHLLLLQIAGIWCILVTQTAAFHSNRNRQCLLTHSCPSPHLDPEAFGVIGDLVVISKGLEAGLDLANTISSTHFVKSALDLVKLSMPLMTSVSELTNILFWAASKETAQVSAMKARFVQVNRKMDSMDHKIADIKRLIDWTTIKVSFSEYERTINTMQGEFEVLMDAPPEVLPMFRTHYVLSFEREFKEATRKLYDGLINKNNLFNENLIVAIRKYTRNHRPQVQLFLLRTLGLILKGMQLEVAYMKLANYSTSVVEFWTKDWEMRLQALSKEFLAVDKQMLDGWYKQAGSDIDEHLQLNPSMKSADFTDSLYQYLMQKFPHRNWFVVSYKAVENTDMDDEQFATVCEGFTRYNQNNRSVVVSTSPVDAPKVFDSKEAKEIMEKLDTYMGYVGNGAAKVVHGWFSKLAPLDCKKFSTVLVGPINAELHMMSQSGRNADHIWDGWYWRFMVPQKCQFILTLMG